MVIQDFSTLRVKLGSRGWRVIQQQVRWPIAKEIWTPASLFHSVFPEEYWNWHIHTYRCKVIKHAGRFLCNVKPKWIGRLLVMWLDSKTVQSSGFFISFQLHNSDSESEPCFGVFCLFRSIEFSFVFLLIKINNIIPAVLWQLIHFRWKT